MPCVISVLMERPEAAASLLTATRQLADRVGPSEITMLAFLRPISVPMIVMTEARSARDTATEFAATEQVRLSALGDAFDRWAGTNADENVTSRRRLIEEDPAAAIKECGRTADFIVVARPTPDDDSATQEMFRAAIFDTDRPVLVVPAAPHKSLGQRVAIAWRDEKHARQALISSVPVIKAAAEIHVFAGRREGQPPPVIPDVLHGFDPPPTLHELAIGGRPLGETILSQARVLNIDLLVMGAYFHSPLRERIFGGVTRYMLANADLPLLMFH